MKATAAGAEFPGPAASAPDGVRAVGALTLVLWSGCLVVGLYGLAVPYPRARPPRAVPPPPPVPARLLEVKLTRVPLAPLPARPAPAAPALPPPAPVEWVIPTAPTLAAVAQPSPAVAFALPVEGASRVVPPAEAGQVRPAVPVAAPLAATPPRSLAYGEGEGLQPAPAYPRAAVRGRQEGTVRVGFTVGVDGRVLAVEVLAASPWPLLDEAALRVVREQWRFAPGALRRYEIPIEFKLRK